jgi:predicted metal-binding membrane protein
VGSLSAAESPAHLGRPASRGELAAAVAAMRTQLGLVALLFGLAGLAWWATADRMAGMDAGPGTDLGTFGWFLGVWIVMMGAMMFPSVAPTVALYAQMTRRRGLSRPLLFASGYLLVWGAAGAVAYGLFELGRSLFGADLAWHAAGRWLVGGILVVAAIYELTPLKDVCLAKCRSPLGFLLGSWRDGRRGALEMGARHAAWCVGCCWALMVALFALGVMSVGWMAFVAALIAIEKLAPWKSAANRAIAVTLVVLGLAVAIVPAQVPGLTVPTSASDGMTMQGDSSMQMQEARLGPQAEGGNR